MTQINLDWHGLGVEVTLDLEAGDNTTPGLLVPAITDFHVDRPDAWRQFLRSEGLLNLEGLEDRVVRVHEDEIREIAMDLYRRNPIQRDWEYD